MKSTTQVIWQDFLNMPDYLPAKPPKRIDAECWLCGGDTGGQGWTIKGAIGGAFTDHNEAKAPHSQTVCTSCAALTSKDAWVFACEKHGHDPYFPVKDGKKPFLANWMFSSHVFSLSSWLRPDRAGIREVLLSPPTPPFSITIAIVGKKHVIFRGAINHSRDRFFVQADERRILVDRSLFRELLTVVERGYALGFSKSSMETGDYNQAAVMKAGLSVWRELEAELEGWRRRHRGMLMLAAFCCVKDVSENS